MLALIFALLANIAGAQTRPYVGYAYPAGGQQGTTFRVKLGGQGLDDIVAIHVNGQGVTGRIVEYHKSIGPQDIQLLNEQARTLRRGRKDVRTENAMMADDAMMDAAVPKRGGKNERLEKNELLARIDKRVSEYVNRPACAALASILYAEISIAAEAVPGQRELRVETLRGVSNPLVFQVGQLREYCRPPMRTASFQVLGKEELALRKRPTNEVEVAIELPCTVNGQVASGEQNRYRFNARKGQRLVISALARQLIPYIADAVPGWFQPVLALYDAKGGEVAYSDDFRFKPDPTILCEIPRDGEYVFAIHDSIYRGREDFVYRIVAGEVPFVTSIFPLGGKAGMDAAIKSKGWNLGNAQVDVPPPDAAPGIQMTFVRAGKLVSNPVPFALDTLPESFEKEPNPQHNAQRIQLPAIINGRIDWVDDWDVYQFHAKAGAVVAVEVSARRLESPLDAIVKVTDAKGRIIALNDDREDLNAGVNTHHADSYLMAKLPTNGTYFVHIGDTSRSGGEEYGYRLRISPPQPDFALRVVPSSISIRTSNSASVTVYAMRRDGFTNTIRLSLKNPPPGFSAQQASLSGTQLMTRLTIKADLPATKEPVTLSIMGAGRVTDRVVTNIAVGAEDRMQAFLWRHLVPSAEFKAQVFDPAYTPPPKRIARERPPMSEERRAALTNQVASAKFTKRQVAGRLRQLKLLFEEGLLTDEFYEEKVEECEAAQ